MRDIAAKHGYYYDGVQLGEFYQLQLVLDIARQMEQICPQAWLIQVANPVFNCTTLVGRETGIKVCGLCHGHYGYRDISHVIGIDPERVTWQAPGFNHNIWLTHFFYEGQNAYPLIDAWIETHAEEYWKTHVSDHTHDCEMSRAAVHQYRMYGLFPVGDTYRRVGAGPTVGCTVYRGEWWLHTDFDTKRYWFNEPFGGPDTVKGRRWFDEQLRQQIADMIKAANDPQTKLTEIFGTTKTDEEMVPIIDGLVNDNVGQYQVNVPNRGTITGIPDDVVVEVPAVVSNKGIQPIHIGSLPPKLMIEALLPHWLDMERNLLAFKTGDRSILLWNALDSHQTRSYDQAMAVMEDLLSMEGHEEMNNYFKFPPNW
jgi:alpha-galactosidase